MNKEKYNQIIDDVYGKALLEYGFQWLPATQSGSAFESRESFIRKIKVDNEFSERFGLKIEERELSLEERIELIQPYGMDALIPEARNKWMVDNSIPTKLITVTCKDEKLEFYE